MKFIIIAVVVFALIIPGVRRLLFLYLPKVPRFLYWKVIDTYRYFKYKEWLRFDGFGLHIFVGMFGKGKTISAVKHVYQYARKYPQVRVYTNINLYNFPDHTEIIDLTNYQQIIDAPGDSIFLVDEISSIFQSRSYATFPPALMGLLLQVRKEKKMIVGTAQRFPHVDKLIRDITFNVIDCSLHYKRFQILKFYDGLDWEEKNVMNIPTPLMYQAYITTDRDRHRYDTEELISKMKKEGFISAQETLEKQGGSGSVIAIEKEKKKKSVFK